MRNFKIGTLLGISVAGIITITSLLIISIFYFVGKQSIEELVDNIIVQITNSIRKDTEEYVHITNQVNHFISDLFKKNILSEDKQNLNSKKNDEIIKTILNYYNKDEYINILSKSDLENLVRKKVYQFDKIFEFFDVIFLNYPEVNEVKYANVDGDFIHLKKMKDQSFSTGYFIPYKDYYFSFWYHKNLNYYYYDKDFGLSNSIIKKEDTVLPKDKKWFVQAVKRSSLKKIKKDSLPFDNSSNLKIQNTYWKIPDLETKNEIGFSNFRAIYNEDNKLLGVIGITMYIMNILYDHALEMKFNEDTHVFILDKNENILLYSPQVLKKEKHLISFFQKKKITKQIRKLAKVVKKKVQLLNILDIKDPLYKKAFLKLRENLIQKNKKISEIQQFSFNFNFNESSYLGVLSAFPVSSNLDWIVGIFFPKKKYYNQINSNTMTIAFISALIVIIGFFIALMLASRISESLKILSNRTKLIGELKISEKDASYKLSSSIIEFQNLNKAFNNMILSLRSFKKYVPADVVRVLLKKSKEATLEGKQEILTIYFSDIADFTSISENLTPQQLVSFLSKYLEKMTSEILKNKGTLDKYIGDAIMAFWGAPNPIAHHALLACYSAINNNRNVILLNNSPEFLEQKIQFKTRIGIHTGEVIVGNIGSEARINYTIMGDSVNLASRLEGLNKFYNTNIICSESTYKQVQQNIAARKLDYVVVKGKNKGIFIYEVLELREFISADLFYFISIYEKALNLYLNANFSLAMKIFKECLRINPKDTPSLILYKRCLNYIQNPPLKWDPAFVFQQK